jgi:hypothetical protein
VGSQWLQPTGERRRTSCLYEAHCSVNDDGGHDDGDVLAVLAGTAAAHPDFVSNPNYDQVVANGQNHPGFVTDSESGLITMCEGVNEPANSGPAGYGLETAHHGPDAGTPGKGDGCYAVVDDAPHPRTPTPLSTDRWQRLCNLRRGL